MDWRQKFGASNLIMVGAKNLNFLLVFFYAIILSSLSPRFCKAQGSNNTSSNNISELDDMEDSMKIILIVVVVGCVIIIMISISVYFSWKWIDKRHRGMKKIIELGKAGPFVPVDTALEYALSQANLGELPLFDFKMLANATNNFSDANELGTGSFGTVYKGKIANGREIAVKRIFSKAFTQGIKEFLNEMTLISKLQHRNLVGLLGCCVENKVKMLVYEYMPNKSLDFFLFDPSQEVLDWRKRFNIIEGICRGLLYLHRNPILKIIHTELKPNNVLMDKDCNPKISDFGLARMFEMRMIKLRGYMAPEYVLLGRPTEKSDVFTFGVLVLEIVTGRRIHRDGSMNLFVHIWKSWNVDNAASIIDPRISCPNYRAEVVRCIHIALLCVQNVPKDRPSVSTALSMLRSEIIELAKPTQSSFTVALSHYDKY